MKHKGAVMEFAEERLADLMRVYYEYWASCDYIRMPKLYASIVQQPSKRFWVSEIRASLVVSSMLRGEDRLLKMCPQKRKMYEEIYRRVLALKEQYPDKRITELCSIVVEQPAPEFYITAGSAKMMICKARKQWERNKIEKLLKYITK